MRRKNFMCIFDFLDILFGKDAKKDKQNAIPFTDGEKSATIAATISKIASAIATTRNATDNRECCALLQKKHVNGLFLPFLS